MTLIQRLRVQIEDKMSFQSGLETAPDCVLWPDKSGEWQNLVSTIAYDGFSIFRLGPFEASEKRGPASYLLWAIHHVQKDSLKVLYLPGVGIEELRAVDSCPLEIQPLAGLRYRSATFIHPNGKDWSIPGWFCSSSGAGLKMEDTDLARGLLRSSFKTLLEKEMTDLDNCIWTADSLSGAVITDPSLSALEWLGSQGAKTSVAVEGWPAFRDKAMRDFGFNPEKDSGLQVAQKLASANPKLEEIWKRFVENPSRHPGIEMILSLLPIPESKKDELIPPDRSRYPLWYRSQISSATDELKQLASSQDHRAIRLGLETLWKKYSELEETVWARLDPIPFLPLLRQICELARLTTLQPPAAGWEEIIQWYLKDGSTTDLLALRLIGWKADLSLKPVVVTLIDLLYRSWLESLSSLAEQAYRNDPSAFIKQPLASSIPYIEGEAVLFVDALRLDLGCVLHDRLTAAGLLSELQAGLTVLPSTTSTAKAAASPLCKDLHGGNIDEDDAYPVLDGKACTAVILRKGLQERGWLTLAGDLDALPAASHTSSKAWLEHGDLDTRGHEGSLPDQWSSILDGIVFTVSRLLSSGWKRVRIVTDHGWLLTPTALPKTVLPSALVSSKGGRAAILSPGSVFPNLPIPWYWDSVRNYNLAPGISTFHQSTYAHGGLSLQEIVVPTLFIRAGSEEPRALKSGLDVSLQWKGLRLRIGLDEHPSEWSMDLRSDAGDEASSLIGGMRTIGPSIAVDDSFLAQPAQFLILDENGTIIVQKPTIIGG